MAKSAVWDARSPIFLDHFIVDAQDIFTSRVRLALRGLAELVARYSSVADIERGHKRTKTIVKQDSSFVTLGARSFLDDVRTISVDTAQTVSDVTSALSLKKIFAMAAVVLPWTRNSHASSGRVRSKPFAKKSGSKHASAVRVHNG